MILAAVLAVGIGIALGLLGGGGSILTVPVLVHALGLAPKPAIATSLLVVGVTAIAALIPHAIAGRVAWRTGLLFGAAGMVGAFGGGAVARYLPAWLLLGGFALMMLATGVAMLVHRRDPGDEGRRKPAPLWRILADGLVVGAITGLVGAGGGFLVVPALTLLGGLPMKRAVGTSLLVIAMKSLAGFAGYAGHVAIDLDLAAVVAGAAAAGALGGAFLASRVRQDVLRQGFAWFVLIAAVAFVALQIPADTRAGDVYRALLVERWPWWAGGLGVAAVVLGLLFADGKLLGVTTGLSETCALPRGDTTALRSWRPGVLIGIVLGGAAAAAFAGFEPQTTVPLLGAAVGDGAFAQALWLGAGGLAIGWGARRAGGCTSGHGIVGTAQLAPASLTATALFLAGGFATTWLLVAAGGAR